MKRRMRPTAAVAAIIMIAGLFAGCTVVDNTAVATVNGEKILKTEFAFYFSQMQSTMLSEAQVTTVDEANAFWETTEIEGKKAADVARERALDEAVKVVLKAQKAEELGVSLTSEDKQGIERQIGQTITGMGGQSKYEAELKKMGSNAAGYKTFIEHNTLAGKVDQKLKEDPAYTATDEETRAYVEENFVRAKHILLLTQDPTTQEKLDEATVAEKKAKAEDLLAQIRGGADFDTLMNENSEDTGLSTNPDGYTFGKGQMVKPFEEAAYALGVDEMSDIVESSFGYHIIKRLPLTDEGIESSLEQGKAQLVDDKMDAQVEAWRKDATIAVEEKVLSKIEITKLEESAA